MKYKISIKYQTGNSFGSEECTSSIEYEWENIQMCADSLKRIDEHYRWYRSENSNWGEKEKRPDWMDKDCGEFSMLLLADDGKEFRYSPFWVGYFERLHHASIETILPSYEY